MLSFRFQSDRLGLDYCCVDKFRVHTKVSELLSTCRLKLCPATVFGATPTSEGRKRIANKLKNPRIKLIHFHTLRRYSATMDYHYNKDILRAMKKFGHRNIQNMLIYTQLVNFGEDEWNVKVAHNVDEACELAELGLNTSLEGILMAARYSESKSEALNPSLHVPSLFLVG